jgi:hypothetical protein
MRLDSTLLQVDHQPGQRAVTPSFVEPLESKHTFSRTGVGLAIPPLLRPRDLQSRGKVR